MSVSIYVSTLGNDFTGTGSIGSPVRTVERALQLIPHGTFTTTYNIVFDNPGSYDAFYITFNHYFTTLVNRLAFLNNTIGQVNITSFDQLASTTINEGHIDIIGLTFKSTHDDAINLINVSDILIDQCIVNQAVSHGIHFEGSGSSIKISRTKIYDCQKNGVYIDTDTSKYTSVLIENCLIYDNVYDGIKVRDANQVTIQNNTIAFNNTGIRLAENNDITPLQVIAANNNITDNYYGIYSNVNLVSTTITHNNLFNNNTNYVNVTDQIEDISADPAYINATARNFALQDISTSINQGLDDYRPVIDFDGNSRTKLRTDIGAFVNTRAERKAFIVQNTRHIIKRVDLEQTDNTLVDASFGHFNQEKFKDNSYLNFPINAIKVGSNIFVADTENLRLMKLDLDLNLVSVIDVFNDVGRPIQLLSNGTHIYCVGDTQVSLKIAKYDLALTNVFTASITAIGWPKSISFGFAPNEIILSSGMNKILVLVDSGTGISSMTLTSIQHETDTYINSHLKHSNGFLYLSSDDKLIKIDNTYTRLNTADMTGRPVLLMSEVNGNLAVYDLQNNKVMFYDGDLNHVEDSPIVDSGFLITTDYKNITSYFESYI